jgi:hypothetical protein
MSAIWSYRVRAAEEAAELPPSINESFVLPSGTAIDALLRNGIGRDATPGESVTAFVSNPVTSGGTVVIPAEAQLNGTLEQISVTDRRAEVLIRFSVLSIRGRPYTIDARDVMLRLPVVSDIEGLSAAFKALMATSLGTSIGAASRDERLVERGLLEGTKMVQTTGISIPITVTITRNLSLEAA